MVILRSSNYKVLFLAVSASPTWLLVVNVVFEVSYVTTSSLCVFYSGCSSVLHLVQRSILKLFFVYLTSLHKLIDLLPYRLPDCFPSCTFDLDLLRQQRYLFFCSSEEAYIFWQNKKGAINPLILVNIQLSSLLDTLSWSYHISQDKYHLAVLVYRQFRWTYSNRCRGYVRI